MTMPSITIDEPIVRPGTIKLDVEVVSGEGHGVSGAEVEVTFRYSTDAVRREVATTDSDGCVRFVDDCQPVSVEVAVAGETTQSALECGRNLLVVEL